MDGNGRWARKKNLPRTAGHSEGLNAAKRVVKAASDLHIKYLTLFTFSTENWQRTEEEVSFLMKLIRVHLKKEYDFYRENQIRVVHCGNIADLPKEVKKEIVAAVRDTAHYGGLTVNLAVNYGGRDEIVRAVNRYLTEQKQQQGAVPPMSEETISTNLDVPEVPDVDLLIRTGGEMRISNFLIWQGVYAELYFSKKLWPDWNGEDLQEAIDEYSRRERRFGGVKEA
jgi:undecaprenyl diphosphate synthase